MTQMTPQDILKFWFEETDPKLWFKSTQEFDDLIKQKYSFLYEKVLAGEYANWRQTPEGRLAEIIVLDQFSRNLFREDAKQFAGDAMALALAQEAISQGFDQQLLAEQRAFLYLPLMHSESTKIHEQALALYTQLGLKGNLQAEQKHKAIIDRFGRYPHRNKVLGRLSTPEELAFLSNNGRGF